MAGLGIVSGVSSTIDVTTMFETAIQGVQTSVMGLFGVALPVGLTIMGVSVSVGLAVKFFKKLTN